MDQETTLNVKEIAELLSITTRAAQIRAAREGWQPQNGGKGRRYLLESLPPDLQAVWFQRDFSQSICKKDSGFKIELEGEYLERLPKVRRERALRWLRILYEFGQYSCETGKKSKEKVRKAFCQSYCARHPNETSFSPGTLKEKFRRFRRNKFQGLVDGYGAVKKFAAWPEEAKALLKQQFLHVNAPPVSFCIDQVKLKAKQEGWYLPSDATMRRFLNGIDPETRDYHRRGERYWKQHYLPSVLRDYESLKPNEVWVADHRQFNVAVRLPSGKIGFPWITTFMDMKTRVIVGWEICETPSSDSIRMALKKGIEKFGVPEHVILDNGRDFSCHVLSGKAKRFRLHLDETEFTGIFLQLGIEPHFCIPGNPQAKSVERWFWTLETHFDVGFPTYRGNGILNRPEGVDARIKSEKHTIEWADFLSWLGNWVGSYNQIEHRGDGMHGRSPIQVWNEYFKSHEQRRVSSASLRLLLLKGKRVKVGRFGVRAFESYYRDDLIMERVTQWVMYRYDPEDLSQIHVYAMDDSYISSPQQIQRTHWQDEKAFVEVKRLEKKKRQAILAERTVAEEIYKAEYGYQMREVNETAESPKVVRLMRTPFDGLQEKIDSEKEARSATAGAVISGFRSLYQYNDQPADPDEDEDRPELEVVSTKRKKGKTLRLPWGKGI